MINKISILTKKAAKLRNTVSLRRESIAPGGRSSWKISSARYIVQTLGEGECPAQYVHILYLQDMASPMQSRMYV